MDQINQENKSFNSQLTNTIDKLIRSYQNNVKAEAGSPSPPLLLLQTGNESTDDSSKPSDTSSNSSCEKPLALIQANDLNEMNLVLKSLKINFPNVNVHLCLNSLNETNVNNKEERHKLSPKASTNQVQIKNCLSASYKHHSDRASSIDNSTLSIERQESRDSGFWTTSKCSFESTKSLSISDSHSNDATAPTTLLIPIHLQQQQQQHSSKPQTPTNEEKAGASGQPENEISRKYLTSPTSFSKSPLYNWKKWKKGQAWRYNSSGSNLSQSDCSTNNEDALSRNNSLNCASFDSTNMNSNQANENELGDTASIPNLSQTHASSHFSNSFESSCTTPGSSATVSNLTIQTSNLNHHMWSSTSKLDELSNHKSLSFSGTSTTIPSAASTNFLTVEQSKAHKRRGKLVRDRTIDNTDDQQSLNSFNNLTINNNSNNLTNNHVKLESTRFDSISSLISPLSISNSKDSLNNLSNSNNQRDQNPFLSTNGRVSPPEKRVSLNNTASSPSSTNQNQDLEQQQQQHQSPNLNLIMSHLLNQNKIPQSAAKTSASSSLSSSPAPTPSSIHDVMNSAAVVAAAAAIAAVMSNNPSPGTGPSNPSTNDKITGNFESTSFLNQYDFYKDLQAKLSIKTNENDEANKVQQAKFIPSSNSMFKSTAHSPSTQSPNNQQQQLKQVNYLSNQQQTTKIVSRSNSSPSYSSFSSIPTQQQPNPMPSPIQYSSPSSSSLYQQPQTNNQVTGLDSNHKINIFSPIQPYNGAVPFTANKSLSTVSLPMAAHFSPTNSPFNPLNINSPEGNSNNSNGIANTNSTNSKANNALPFFGNQNRLNNPPEIVITESKGEHDQIEYEQANNYINYSSNNNSSSASKVNQENQNYGNVKQENIFNVTNLYHHQQMHQQNAAENIYKKDATNIAGNMFENWKSVNPFMSMANKSPNQNVLNPTAAGVSNKQAKPHVCPSCQKRFARSDMLIRHSRLHSGVRPYRCNRCGQEFSRSDHLNTHLRTHTGEKPYSCPHPKCTYAACRKDMITRHLKVHNKNRMSLSFDNTSTSQAGLLDNTIKNNQFLSESTGKLLQFPSMSFESANINFKQNKTNENQSHKVEDLKDIKNFEIFNQNKSS